jgi:hypothetical protein
MHATGFHLIIIRAQDLRDSGMWAVWTAQKGRTVQPQSPDRL